MRRERETTNVIERERKREKEGEFAMLYSTLSPFIIRG